MRARDAKGRFLPKAWQDLAPKTQKEKLRYGIGPREHAAGVRTKELQTFIKDAEKYYGADRNEVREELKNHDLPSIMRGIRAQKEMFRAYHDGDVSRARALWEARDRSLPEWMFYYHGAFS